jgi:hypothetical protein
MATTNGFLSSPSDKSRKHPTPSPSTPPLAPFGSRPTTFYRRRRRSSGRSCRSQRSWPWVANPTARALSSKPSLGSASKSARSRWAPAAPSFSRWSTTPPPSNFAAASRFFIYLFILFIYFLFFCALILN